MSKDKLMLAGLWLVGFNSLLAQVLLMRELLGIFYGNELSLGVVLACWLCWSALGSAGTGWLTDGFKEPGRVFVWVLLLLPLLLAVTFQASRLLPLFLQFPPGELVAPWPMLYSSWLLLAPLAFCLGFLFTLACRIYSALRPPAGIAVGRAYLWEGLGAGTAGLCFTYFMVAYLDPWQTVLVSAWLTLSLAALLSWEEYGGRVSAPLLVCCAMLLLVVAANLPTPLSRMEGLSLTWRWGGHTPLISRDSPYGKLTLTRRGTQVSLWENGLLMFSRPDLLSAEEGVHLALLAHESPERVLLIGGGMGGGLAETLKHPSVRAVDYVELDPMSIELGLLALPEKEKGVFKDRRVRVHYQDGRLFVARAQRKYDVVIVNLPEPSTAQLNRFYTAEFFSRVKEILAPRGLLCLGLSSSENYIGRELARFLGSVYFSMKDVFPAVAALPGESTYLLGCTEAGALPDDWAVLSARLQERDLETKYVREYYIPFRFSPERVAALEKRLREMERVRRNNDFSPVSYYYQLLFWLTYTAPETARLFAALADWSWQWGCLWLFAAGLFFASPAVWRSPERWRGRAVLYAVMTTGVAEMAFEVIVILAFQILFGYLYHNIGLILAGFMAGLALGGFYATRRLPGYRDPYRLLRLTQAAVCLYPWLLIFVLSWLSRRPATGVWRHLFPFLTAVAGMTGGFQFPLAAKVYMELKPGAGRAVGIVYGIDLAGACLGALLVSAILLPLLGVYPVCILLSLLNLSALFFLFRGGSGLRLDLAALIVNRS